jgi:transposase
MSGPPPPQRRPDEAKVGRRQVDLPVARIAALHAAGMSLSALAKRFGVARSVIRDRLKRAQQVPP